MSDAENVRTKKSGRVVAGDKRPASKIKEEVAGGESPSKRGRGRPKVINKEKEKRGLHLKKKGETNKENEKERKTNNEIVEIKKLGRVVAGDKRSASKIEEKQAVAEGESTSKRGRGRPKGATKKKRRGRFAKK